MADPPSGLQALPSLSEAGKYVMGDRLATGGMAEVYKGWLRGSEGFRRPVVIKKMLPRLAADPRFVRMFIEEARLASRLVHANIVQILDFGRIENEHFIVLEYIDGPNLNELILKARQQGSKRLPLPLVAYLVGEILKGLDHAHRLTDSRGERLGCVHRDVTPSNILLSRDGQVKLSDFGVARAADRASWTAPGQIRGKLHYLSPEQVKGETVDPRADIFAVGVLLHELLCGRRLFGGETPMQVMEATLSGPVPPPSARATDVPAELDAVALTALQRDRERRYPDAETFHQALVRGCLPHFTPGRSRDLVAYLDRLLGPPPAVADDPLLALIDSQISMPRLEPEEGSAAAAAAASAASAASAPFDDRTRPMSAEVLANLGATALEMPVVAAGPALRPDVTVPVARPAALMAAEVPRRPVVHPPVAVRDERPRPASPSRVAEPIVSAPPLSMGEPVMGIEASGDWAFGGPTAPDGLPAERDFSLGDAEPAASPPQDEASADPPPRGGKLLVAVALVLAAAAGAGAWLALG